MEDVIYDVLIYIDKEQSKDIEYLNYLMSRITAFCDFSKPLAAKIVTDMVRDGKAMIFSHTDVIECANLRNVFLSQGIHSIVDKKNYPTKKR